MGIEFHEQVAVVTGGGRGIGAAIARRLAGLGMMVVISGRTPKPLRSTEAAIVEAGGRCQGIVADVTDLSSVEALAAQVERSFGRVDALVNNAGIGGFGGPLHQMPPENWDAVLNTNLRGVYYCIRAPLMARMSRRHEFEADAYAATQASAQDLADALLKLYRDDASTLTPDPLYVRFYYSHPPASERIARLGVRLHAG